MKKQRIRGFPRVFRSRVRGRHGIRQTGHHIC